MASIGNPQSARARTPKAECFSPLQVAASAILCPCPLTPGALLVTNSLRCQDGKTPWLFSLYVVLTGSLILLLRLDRELVVLGAFMVVVLSVRLCLGLYTETMESKKESRPVQAASNWGVLLAAIFGWASLPAIVLLIQR